MAVRAARQKKDVEEVGRLNRVKSQLKKELGDPVKDSRQSLENTIWTIERGGETFRLVFGEDYKLVWAKKSGEWTMLNPQSLAIFLGSEIFVLKFNDDLSNFKVLRAYRELRTEFTGGVRVKN